MTKADKFRAGIDKVQDMDIDPEYMSDMSNWCMVHATKYLPCERPDGSLYIPSTAMAENFQYPRSTVHVTLNHVVTSHGYGSWDDTPIIILAPYNDVVAKNGKPAEVAGTDTYWSVDPDSGLVLPKSAYVIKPDNNGPLFKIGKNGATYKRDNYSDEEVKIIESMLNEYDRQDYMKYKDGDIEEWDIENQFAQDKRIKRMYEGAKDKKAFLRGLFEEARFDILSKYLRDAVVKMSMEKIGKTWSNGISDGSKTSEIIANTAEASGVLGNPSNKGHSNSIYANVEDFSWTVTRVLYGDGLTNIPSMFETKAQSLYDVIMERGPKDPVVSAVIDNIVNGKQINFLKMFEEDFATNMQTRIDYVQTTIKSDQDMLNRFANDIYKDRIAKNRKYVQEMSKKKTIAAYDKNLAETVKRHCKRLAHEYDAWRKDLEKQPGFDKLVQDLRALVMTRTMINAGRDY